MDLNRIYIPSTTDNYLRALSGRTGLKPNILCRMGFCLSIRESTLPNPSDYSYENAREFNRYTLTGPWDKYFIALMKERYYLVEKNNEKINMEDHFVAHINRGVHLLFQRVKHLSDISHLVENS